MLRRTSRLAALAELHAQHEAEQGSFHAARAWDAKVCVYKCIHRLRSSTLYFALFVLLSSQTKREADALGVITISRGCFERCCSNKKTPPYPHSNLSFVTLRSWRPTLLRAPAYRTPSEASPRRRCGHASRHSRNEWGANLAKVNG